MKKILGLFLTVLFLSSGMSWAQQKPGPCDNDPDGKALAIQTQRRISSILYLFDGVESVGISKCLSTWAYTALKIAPPPEMSTPTNQCSVQLKFYNSVDFRNFAATSLILGSFTTLTSSNDTSIPVPVCAIYDDKLHAKKSKAL